MWCKCILYLEDFYKNIVSEVKESLLLNKIETCEEILNIVKKLKLGNCTIQGKDHSLILISSLWSCEL